MIAGILLVVAIVVAFVFSNKNAKNTTNTNTATNTPVVNIVTSTNTGETPTNTLSPEDQQKSGATRAASIFVEQYGTYNGGFNAGVLNNLKPLVTEVYAGVLQKTVVSTSSDDNTSITTQVLNTAITNFAMNASAIVTVSTLRVQTSGTDQKQTQLSQEIVVRESCSNGQWLVSSAEWKSPQNLDSL